MKRRYSSLLIAHSQSLISIKNQTRFEIFKTFWRYYELYVHSLPPKRSSYRHYQLSAILDCWESGHLVNLFSYVIKATSTCRILQIKYIFWNFWSFDFDLTWKKAQNAEWQQNKHARIADAIEAQEISRRYFSAVSYFLSTVFNTFYSYFPYLMTPTQPVWKYSDLGKIWL